MKEMPSKFKVHKSTAENGDAPLFVFHHGAGQTGTAFTLLIKALHESITCSTLAFDARGHGKTQTSNDSDLSLGTLVSDFVQVVEENRGDAKVLVLVGHSMGAPIVIDAVSHGIKGCIGCVVIDVVEGTAIESLSKMDSILDARPSSFKTIASAVDWVVSTRQVKNRISAEISVPSQIIESDGEWRWRTDLKAGSQYWRGWFSGMSKKFLQIKCARLLVLAGSDRLDKELIIGQMQGKFQLEIIEESGHYVHEDAPEKLARILSAFYSRNLPLDIAAIRQKNIPC